ncbi:MAG: ribosome biogenesis GTPase Der [Candidatus Omnitrophica bacterium]|nr:ribosome biogenesis GTPase Der [Candidatus Omnitrophota bacterium]
MRTMPDPNRDFPKIAIVGRSNVGKSSLFNRIAGARRVIVHMETGTTRDRITQKISFGGRNFILIDTGGFAAKDNTNITNLMISQISRAIAEADILLFVCDGQTGPRPEDFELAARLRRFNKRVFLVVNKVDNRKLEASIYDFYELGLDRPYPVSSLHNTGVSELLDDAVKLLPEAAPEREKTDVTKVAVVGRPNVGKSSFVNCLLDEERVIVDERPGTTRDAIDTYLRHGDEEFVLIDTAGMRHKRKIKEAVDVYSLMRAKEAVKRSDACIVLIDAYDGLMVDDIRIAELVLEEGKCCVLCVNKWDLIKGLPQEQYRQKIYDRAGFLSDYPVIFTSAKTAYNVLTSLEAVKEAVGNSNKRVATPRLNKLMTALKTKGPFYAGKNRVRPVYAVQTTTAPPSFLIFVNEARLISEPHRNFIENRLRKEFGFFGSPVKLVFRNSKGGGR